MGSEFCSGILSRSKNFTEKDFYQVNGGLYIYKASHIGGITVSQLVSQLWMLFSWLMAETVHSNNNYFMMMHKSFMALIWYLKSISCAGKLKRRYSKIIPEMLYPCHLHHSVD